MYDVGRIEICDVTFVIVGFHQFHIHVVCHLYVNVPELLSYGHLFFCVRAFRFCLFFFFHRHTRLSSKPGGYDHRSQHDSDHQNNYGPHDPFCNFQMHLPQYKYVLHPPHYIYKTDVLQILQYIRVL